MTFNFRLIVVLGMLYAYSPSIRLSIATPRSSHPAIRISKNGNARGNHDSVLVDSPPSLQFKLVPTDQLTDPTGAKHGVSVSFFDADFQNQLASRFDPDINFSVP